MRDYNTNTRGDFRTTETPLAEKILVAGLHLSASKVLVWKAAKSLGGRFRTDVTLRCSKQFVTDHEFSHCRRAQQRRIEVTMQVPFRVVSAVCGLLVETHRVRK